MTYKVYLEQQTIWYLLCIFRQIWWPVKLSYCSTNRFYITNDIVNSVVALLEEKEEWGNVSLIELFSIISICDYIINDLGIDDHHTILGVDIVQSLQVLRDLKRLLVVKK